MAVNVLRKVGSDKHFKIHMGTDISSLSELVEALEVMSEESFNHHVTKNKNDFKAWIEHVIKDEELASSLAAVKTKEFMAKKIKDRIAESGKAKVVVTEKKLNKFGLIDFSIGVAVGVILGILLCSL